MSWTLRKITLLFLLIALLAVAVPLPLWANAAPPDSETGEETLTGWFTFIVADPPRVWLGP